MAAVSTIIAASALAVAAAGTGYSIYSAEEAKSKAEREANEQEKRQEKILADQKAQREQIKADEAELQDSLTQEAERDTQKARQRSLAAGAQGRGSTILTSPLGVPGSANTAGKTLLGL